MHTTFDARKKLNPYDGIVGRRVGLLKIHSDIIQVSQTLFKRLPSQNLSGLKLVGGHTHLQLITIKPFEVACSVFFIFTLQYYGRVDITLFRGKLSVGYHVTVPY